MSRAALQPASAWLLQWTTRGTNIRCPGHAACPAYGPAAEGRGVFMLLCRTGRTQPTAPAVFWGSPIGFGSPTLATIPLTFAFNEHKLWMFLQDRLKIPSKKSWQKVREKVLTQKAFELHDLIRQEPSAGSGRHDAVREAQALSTATSSIPAREAQPQCSVSRSQANFQQRRSQWGQRFLHLPTHFRSNCGTTSLHGQYTAGGGGKECGSVSL